MTFRTFLFRNNSWPQWIAAFEIFVISNALGSVTGWTSPSLAKLTSSHSPILVSANEAAWIASLLIAGRAIGSLIGAIILGYLGSKSTVFVAGIFQASGLICLAIANSIVWIYMSRVICGTAIGIFLLSFPMYIGEISNPKLRGAMICLIAGGQASGYLLGNIIAVYMSFSSFALLILPFTLIFLGSFIWLPDSPHYLVQKNKNNEAAAAIEFYQRDANVSAELESLRHFVNEKKMMTFCDILKELIQIPHNRNGLIKINVLLIVMQMSGIYAIVFYSEIILIKAGVTFTDPAIAVIIITSIGMMGDLMAMFTSDSCGRKFLLCISSLGIAVALFSLGIHFELLNQEYDSSHFQWLPVLSISLLAIFINFGLVGVPSVIVSEIFAPNVKGLSVCITNILAGLSAFFVTGLYQTLLDSIDYYVYYLYGLMMIIVCLFTLFFLPETKGKTLQEIQEMLRK